MASVAASPRTPASVLALAVLKGALARAIGFPIGRTTVGVKYSANNRARITVKLGDDVEKCPSDDVLASVLDIANSEFAAGKAVQFFRVQRASAEADYGEAMYDKFNIPPEITELIVMHVEDVIFTAVRPDQTFAMSTAVVRSIALEKVKFRANKHELEVQFSVTPSSSDVALLSGDEACASCKGLPLPSKEAIAKLQSTVAQATASPSASTGAADGTAEKRKQIVTPWEVDADGGVDYDKLVRDYGSSALTAELVQRMEKLTGREAHPWLRRGIFFSHRDLNHILDLYEKGEKFYIYTGRGPSSDSLHMGHMLPFMFTQWLQEVFDCPLVIQLTDDEKFLWKDIELADCTKFGRENAKDIIACGFDPKKTFIFCNSSYIGEMYSTICEVQKRVTFNQARGIFGFDNSSNIGKVAFPAIQAVPSFSRTFRIPLRGAPNMPCLIPCAIDQDPYFRMTRDVAPRMKLRKPALMHCKFFPSLRGQDTKMSASAANTAVYTTDTPKQIKKKINKHAFSGGRETAEEQRKYGANLEVDISYQWLRFFLFDDAELESIGEKYANGTMLTGEVKARLIQVLTELTQAHQKRRAEVTEEVLDHFFSVRPLEF